MVAFAGNDVATPSNWASRVRDRAGPLTVGTSGLVCETAFDRLLNPVVR